MTIRLRAPTRALLLRFKEGPATAADLFSLGAYTQLDNLYMRLVKLRKERVIEFDSFVPTTWGVRPAVYRLTDEGRRLCRRIVTRADRDAPIDDHVNTHGAGWMDARQECEQAISALLNGAVP